MPEIQINICQGLEIHPYLDALADLRIRVFRDFPYLYDGSHSYESKYLKRYAEEPGSLFVLAFDGGTLVGAATGMPLINELDEFRKPFEKANFNLSEVFYYGESVLLPEYRGHGIGKSFMKERESHARKAGFKKVAFCAVERESDHPLCPRDYQPLHGFWQQRGYERVPHLQTQFSWKDLGQEIETEKLMVFWLKAL